MVLRFYISIALAGILLVLVILRELKDLKPETRSLISKTIILMAVLLFALQIYSHHLQEKEEKYSQYSGRLIGKVKENIIYPSLKIGTAKFVFKGKEGEPMFILGDDYIKIWLENGELKISTVIRNEEGKIVAKLEGNEWQVNPNLIYDRNFDERAVEIIDDKGRVVFQAIFDGESVEICGIFHLNDGRKVAIGKNVIEIRPPGEPIQLKCPQLFKYPSRLHPGERL